jgi:hypothetical protein
MRTLKAFLLAPLWPLAIIYLWTFAHFGIAYSVIAVINPIMWIIALMMALPAFYVGEFALALPMHYLFEQIGWKTRAHYVFAGAVVGAAACWMWAAIVRAGPLPLHRDVGQMILIGIPAGGIGGAAFWRIAISDRDHAQWLTAKNILITASPLLVLYLGVYMVAGHRYAWGEWASLPFADPGGFGIFLAAAVLITLALAIDRRRRRKPVSDVT